MVVISFRKGEGVTGLVDFLGAGAEYALRFGFDMVVVKNPQEMAPVFVVMGTRRLGQTASSISSRKNSKNSLGRLE